MILQRAGRESSPPIPQKPGGTVLPCRSGPPSSKEHYPQGTGRVYSSTQGGELGRMNPYLSLLAFHSHFVLFSLVH